MLRVSALPPAEGPVYPRRMTTTNSHVVRSTSIRISMYEGEVSVRLLGAIAWRTRALRGSEAFARPRGRTIGFSKALRSIHR